eukprot:346276_1
MLSTLISIILLLLVVLGEEMQYKFKTQIGDCYGDEVLVSDTIKKWKKREEVYLWNVVCVTNTGCHGYNIQPPNNNIIQQQPNNIIQHPPTNNIIQRQPNNIQQPPNNNIIQQQPNNIIQPRNIIQPPNN